VWTFFGKLQERVSRYYNGSSEEEACCLSMCVGVRVLNLIRKAWSTFQTGVGCFTASTGEHKLH